MHERGLINDLLKQIAQLALAQEARQVEAVSVWLGAFCHISGAHFREHFVSGCRGTIAEGADLVLEESNDVTHPHAQYILLLGIDVS